MIDNVFIFTYFKSYCIVAVIYVDGEFVDFDIKETDVKMEADA